MPIICFATELKDVPANAVNLREMDWTPTNHIWMWDTHTGLCLEDHEINGHDDSDWYMVVWNPEKQEPERIEFATTRGWTYPAYGSKPDATPEVLAAYKAWLRKQERMQKCRKIREWRAYRRHVAAKGKLSMWDVMRLIAVYGTTDQFKRVAKLMIADGQNRLRNLFRKKMAKQVRDWLADPAPKYPSPFSRKQFNYV
jgi:hypothetical protein